MKKPKQYFYAGIVRNDGQFRFITDVNTEERTCKWEATKPPYLFHSWDDANYVCLGLMWRGMSAYPIVLNYEHTTALYREDPNGKIKED